MTPDEVKQTLRALALDPDSTPDYERVVERAAESLDRVETAADVCDDVGRARLRAAVDAARVDGNTRIAHAGYRAIRALERYRRAATGSKRADSAVEEAGVGPDGRDERSVRGTSLSSRGQRDDR